MNSFTRVYSATRHSVIAALALCLSGPVLASWELDEARSSVQFLSVKNASVAEVHHFTSFSGAIDDSGQATVTIDLGSVETMVPIRNERMREMLFETVRFPQATLTAQVPDGLAELEAGETTRADLELSIDLHGNTALYTAQTHVTRLADGSLQVVLAAPVLVKAADFGLEGGIEMLREVAGLKTISTAIPVDAMLVFEES